jgi:hypothetical protein
MKNKLTLYLTLMYFISPLASPSLAAERLQAGRDCLHCKLAKSSYKSLNLKGIRLTYSNLEEADFSSAVLQGSDLRFTELRKAKFDEATLEGADFSGARVRQVSFEGTNCSGTKFIFTDLFRGRFRNAKLVGANLTGANLISADFTGADLSGADLTGSHTANVKFSNTLLCNTIMPDGVVSTKCERRAENESRFSNTPPVMKIPARPAGAITGSEFIRKTSDMKIPARELAILDELMQGNIPDFLRDLKPIFLQVRIADRTHNAQIWVMPDYLAIGSNEDFIRIPVNPLTAQKVAEAYGLMLPTPKIVDVIYLQANVQLKPQPFPWGEKMKSNTYFMTHNTTIQEDLAGKAAGLIIAGHKKDVVLTNELLRTSKSRVAIYGWHERHGSPIQPTCITHDIYYADYSHGVRFVSQTIEIDGKILPLLDILKDPHLSNLVSDEGPLVNPKPYQRYQEQT